MLPSFTSHPNQATSHLITWSFVPGVQFTSVTQENSLAPSSSTTRMLFLYHTSLFIIFVFTHSAHFTFIDIWLLLLLTQPVISINSLGLSSAINYNITSSLNIILCFYLCAIARLLHVSTVSRNI